MRTTVKRLLPIALALTSMCGGAWAQQTDNGLGQAWPNATDVSSSPNWHVYVFNRDGIRFIQINDLNGTVRGAFATAGGQFIRLPIGIDAQLVSTPQQPRAASTTNTTSGETVYQDNSGVQVQATPQARGVMLDAVCQDKRGCGGGMQ
jgi:hypothetical protein